MFVLVVEHEEIIQTQRIGVLLGLFSLPSCPMPNGFVLL